MTNVRSLLCLVLLFPLLSFAEGSSVSVEFDKVVPRKIFEFPRDHGAHYNFPIEWWYFTGHLKDGTNRAYGFELTFFRVAVNRTGTERRSPWHVQSIFLAHAALTDDAEQAFYFEKRTARGSFGRASASDERLRIVVDDWRVEQTEDVPGKEEFLLVFDAKDERTNESFALKLNVKADKPPVLQGDRGYSRKGEEVSDASYYISFTRLTGEGSLVHKGEKRSVIASAWMDHEILSSDPNDEQVGWDWFAIQLDSGWECMLYHLRRGKKMETSPYSSGSCVNQEGEMIPLQLADYKISALSSWRSKVTGIEYPSIWDVEVPKLKLKARVTPTVAEQELATPQSPARSYWEGRSLVSGEMGGQRVSGQAYVELVGYKR